MNDQFEASMPKRQKMSFTNVRPPLGSDRNSQARQGGGPPLVLQDPLFNKAVYAACHALDKDPNELIWSSAYEDFLPPGTAVKMPRWQLVAAACGKEFAAIIALVRADEAKKLREWKRKLIKAGSIVSK